MNPFLCGENLEGFGDYQARTKPHCRHLHKDSMATKEQRTNSAPFSPSPSPVIKSSGFKAPHQLACFYCVGYRLLCLYPQSEDKWQPETYLVQFDTIGHYWVRIWAKEDLMGLHQFHH